MNPVAEVVEDVTPEWLSGALGVEVRGVSAERIGTGQTGATYRLALEAEGVPRTMVAKLAAGDEAARRRVRDGYRKEVGFYRDLVATLDVRTPRCWYAAITEDGLSFTLLLEDLSHLSPGVQAEGCSLAEAEDCVRNLPGLHAPRWNDEALFDLEFFHRVTDWGAAYVKKLQLSATEEFVRRYGGDLGPEDVATLRSCAEAMETWILARPEPFAVVHGDYRLDNLLFPPDGDGVVVVDWQSLLVAPPLRDLAYFLGVSLAVEDRRSGEERLVESYHADLVARGVEDYDADRCFDDYRVGHLQGALITVTGATFATAERTRSADAMFLAMARRSCAAIRDLGSLDAL